MANESRIAAMTAIAAMYAQALLNEAGEAADEMLKERLKDVVTSNGSKLIPGASFLGFSSSFVVLPDVVNETSRDMFLAAMAQYLFALPNENPLYIALKRFTLDFGPADIEAATNIRDKWLAPGGVLEATAITGFSLEGGIVQSNAPLHRMATAAFKLVLDALLGEKKYKVVRAKVEARDMADTYTSDLFKIHYLAVAFWFTTMTLPLYTVGLLKGDPTISNMDAMANALFGSQGVNAFLNKMAMSWSKNILAIPAASVDQSISGGGALAESINPSAAANQVLTALKNSNATPPMVDLLRQLDVTGERQLFIAQLKLLTAYYAINIIIGPGSSLNWETAHNMIQNTLGYATADDIIKIALAKGPPLSTSAGGRSGGVIDADTQLKLANARQLGEDLIKERADKDKTVKTAVDAEIIKKAALIAMLKQMVTKQQATIEKLKENGGRLEED